MLLNHDMYYYVCHIMTCTTMSDIYDIIYNM